MKLPSISLNFLKKPSKKKRTITTLGKRTSSASLSVPRKARRSSSSSNPKSRKRSITYYAPSKSKLYPSEHFPSMQRLVRHKTAVAPTTTPLVQRSYSYEKQPTASTDIDAKLIDSSRFSVPNETLHSYPARQIYSCDNDYGDIVVHQPPAWYVPTHSQSTPPPPPPHVTHYKVDQHIVTVNSDDVRRSSNSHRIQSRFHPNAGFIDSNVNKLHDDNYLHNAYVSAYSKECGMQGVPIQSRNASTVPVVNDSNIKYNIAHSIDTDLYTHQIPNNLPQANITNAYDPNKLAFDAINSTNARYTRSNSFPNENITKLYAVHQSKAHQPSTPRTMHGLPIYSATVPFKKKSDRHRRRKVRHSKQKLNAT